MTDVELPPTRFDFRGAVPELAAGAAAHLVPIGGIGLSAVARLLIAAGHRVSGSDANDSALVHSLVEAGAAIAIGPAPELVDTADLIIVNAAVPDSHPDLVRARERGLPVLHRAQALAALTSADTRVAVAGANGKTSTTAMLVAAAQATGLDPTYAIGGEAVTSGVNAESGQDRLAIFEADESDQSFLAYAPDLAIVTSVQPDHLDHYGDAATVAAAYRAFVDTIGTRPTGPERLRPAVDLIVCADDPGAQELAQYATRTGRRVLRYGHGADSDVRLGTVELAAGGSRAELSTADSTLSLQLRVPGARNLENAAAAFAATTIGLGRPGAAVLAGLADFAGTRRRFEHRGSVAGVTVVDDYAHNPAKVESVVATGRAVLGGSGRLVVIFQPHLYSRTRDLADGFGAALAGADVVIVTDVYAAREAPIEGITGALVVDAIGARAAGGGLSRHYVPLLADVPALVAGLVRAGDLVLTVGAGDVTVLAPMLLAAIDHTADAAADGPSAVGPSGPRG